MSVCRIHGIFSCRDPLCNPFTNPQIHSCNQGVIDKLEAENRRLRAALEKIITDWACDYMDCQECGGTKTAKEALNKLTPEVKE